MKKYIAPSVDIVKVEIKNMLVTISAGNPAEDHKKEADSKAVNFAGDNDSFWSTEK